MRGEYQRYRHLVSVNPGSPPLARGIHARNHVSLLWTGITPACAGNTCLKLCEFLLKQDHPRLRGEYEKILLVKIARRGSPPLARGIQIRDFHFFDFHRITPACAGNTIAYRKHTQSYEDHPRLRGEYMIDYCNSAARKGSPPLARGIQVPIIVDKKNVRITPACAGNTLKKA